jgi:hypothetical protein
MTCQRPAKKFEKDAVLPICVSRVSQKSPSLGLISIYTNNLAEKGHACH